MAEPGLAGTTMVASWAFGTLKLGFNEVVCSRSGVERANGTMRGLRVGDVSGIGGAIYR